MRGWYPMSQSQSEDMGKVGFLAIVLLPLLGLIICLAGVFLQAS
jgi:hypothetical protein